MTQFSAPISRKSGFYKFTKNPLARYMKVKWENNLPKNGDLVRDVHTTDTTQSGSELPRKPWIKLNRIRTDQGCCNYLMNQWRMRDNLACDCKAELQTMNHIKKRESSKTLLKRYMRYPMVKITSIVIYDPDRKLSQR